MKYLYKKYPIILVLIGCSLLLFSCQKQTLLNDDLFPDYVNSDNLSQTEWIITRYDNTLTNLSEFPNDTIYFVDSEKYQINGGNDQEYSLSKEQDNSSSERTLNLQDCSTFGGDYWSWFDLSLISVGELNNVLFNGYNDNDIIVWMTRIN